MSKQNEPAYPVISEFGPKLDSSPGLTKLEYAAINIMGALASQSRLSEMATSDSRRWFAQTAVEQAKSLLAELERQQ